MDTHLDNSTLAVYVPKAGTFLDATVIEGSAIVGSPAPDLGPEGRVMVDYEGSAFNQFQSWMEQLLHAAGRHVVRYPTRARAWVDGEDLVRVGTYYVEDSALQVSNSEALAAWLGGEDALERVLEAA